MERLEREAFTAEVERLLTDAAPSPFRIEDRWHEAAADRDTRGCPTRPSRRRPAASTTGRTRRASRGLPADGISKMSVLDPYFYLQARRGQASCRWLPKPDPWTGLDSARLASLICSI
jgi:hypothetical protein